MRLHRGERAGGRHPRIEHGGDRDRPLVVTRQLGSRAAPQPSRVPHQTLQQRGAGVQHRGIAEPEILRRRVRGRTQAQEPRSDSAQECAERPGDCFVNALSGVGYIHEDIYADNFPPEQRQQIWRDFQRLSGLYRQKIGVTVMSTLAEMSAERMALLAGIPGMKGIFANYGRTEATNSENLLTEIAGVPVFRAVNHGPGEMTFTPTGRRNAEYFMINEVKRWTPRQRPAFLHVFLANWLTSMDMAENIAKGLGPEYVAVRPDQLVSLYNQFKGSQA